MTNLRRCIIFVPSDGSVYEEMDDPRGQWIFDPDHKIDVSQFKAQPKDSADKKKRRPCIVPHDRLYYGTKCPECGR